VGKILKSIGLLIGTFMGVCLFLKDVQGKSVEEILAKIDSAGRTIHTFRADFVQKKEIALFASAVTSKGRLVVKYPDLLIWEVLEPLKAFFFIDRGTAGTREPDTGEVKRFRISTQGLDPSYDWLLRVFMGSLGELRKTFKIEVADKDGGTKLLLRLIPLKKDSKAGVREILLGFDPDRWFIQEIIFEETSGDRTEIGLMNIRINTDVRKDIPSWLRRDGKR
jgi:outer membrane lipoprotein-sorting protein